MVAGSWFLILSRETPWMSKDYQQTLGLAHASHEVIPTVANYRVAYPCPPRLSIRILRPAWASSCDCCGNSEAVVARRTDYEYRFGGARS